MAALEKTVPTLQKPHNGEKFALVIHGGAGTMSREIATPEMQALYRMALKAALRAGYAVLSQGGEAMDAAVAAVTSLEGRCSCQTYKANFVTLLFRLSSVQRGQGGSFQ